MAKSRLRDPLRALAVLDAKVDRARGILQRTREVDPAFERRVKVLVRLVAERDEAVAPGTALRSSS